MKKRFVHEELENGNYLFIFTVFIFTLINAIGSFHTMVKSHTFIIFRLLLLLIFILSLFILIILSINVKSYYFRRLKD